MLASRCCFAIVSTSRVPCFRRIPRSWFGWTSSHRSMASSKLPFGFVYDERMLKHECKYDPTMAECPERISLVHQRLLKEGQLKGALQIPAREATDDELLLNHPKELIAELEAIHNDKEAEDFCRNKEILWACENSMEAARLAAGGSIDIVKACVEGRIDNGFAIVRPPGHHSWGAMPQGYCIFNNVAVAAKYAVEIMGVKRVAVVDFDIHPGNGTHYSLRGDPRFHFTSSHLYAHGAFWPFLKEFEYDTAKDTLFFPLNGALNTEGDFMAAFNHVLLPILKEFDPELILISAGFDAAYMDIMLEVGQGIKAHGYGHMARALNEIAPGKVVAILEGGYFPHSYVECASMMVRGLQGAPLPALSFPPRVSAPLRETMLNLIHHHAQHWSAMKDKLTEVQKQQARLGLEPFSPAPKLFLGTGVREHWDMVKKLGASRTREWFPPLPEDEVKRAKGLIDEYVKAYDYSSKTPVLNESTLLEQLIWNDAARGESFLMSAPLSKIMYDDFHDYISGKKDHMMIADVELIREAKAKIEKSDK